MRINSITLEFLHGLAWFGKPKIPISIIHSFGNEQIKMWLEWKPNSHGALLESSAKYYLNQSRNQFINWNCTKSEYQENGFVPWLPYIHIELALYSSGLPYCLISCAENFRFNTHPSEIHSLCKKYIKIPFWVFFPNKKWCEWFSFLCACVWA